MFMIIFNSYALAPCTCTAMSDDDKLIYLCTLCAGCIAQKLHMKVELFIIVVPSEKWNKLLKCTRWKFSCYFYVPPENEATTKNYEHWTVNKRERKKIQSILWKMFKLYDQFSVENVLCSRPRKTFHFRFVNRAVASAALRHALSPPSHLFQQKKEREKKYMWKVCVRLCISDISECDGWRCQMCFFTCCWFGNLIWFSNKNMECDSNEIHHKNFRTWWNWLIWLKSGMRSSETHKHCVLVQETDTERASERQNSLIADEFPAKFNIFAFNFNSNANTSSSFIRPFLLPRSGFFSPLLSVI